MCALQVKRGGIAGRLAAMMSDASGEVAANLQPADEYTRSKLAVSLSGLIGVLATVDVAVGRVGAHDGLALSLSVAVDRVRRHLSFARDDGGAETLCGAADALLAVADEAREVVEGAERLKR